MSIVYEKIQLVISTINRKKIFDKLNAELYRDNFLEQLATESKN
jgi:hypothetical protein